MKTERGGDKIPILVGVIERKKLIQLLPGQANKERSMESYFTRSFPLVLPGTVIWIELNWLKKELAPSKRMRRLSRVCATPARGC